MLARSVVVCLALLVGLVPLTTAVSLGKAPLRDTLAAPTVDAAAAWVDGASFVFGGTGIQPITDIQRHVPGHRAATVAHLPTSLTGTAVAVKGHEVFLFGGLAGSTLSDDILRFDTTTSTLAHVGDLVAPMRDLAAVWTGDVFVLAGGRTSAGAAASIFHVDPSTFESEPRGALPEGRAAPAAAWDGAYVLLFGGAGDGGTSDQVLRYDAASGDVVALPHALPQPWSGGHATWDGAGNFLLVGGGRVPTRYTPCEGAVPVAAARPLVTEGGAAYAFDLPTAWLLGGQAAMGQPSTLIRSFEVALPAVPPCAPTWPGLPDGGLVEASAVWADDLAILVGGATPNGPEGRIMSWGPEGFQILGHLPSPRQGASAVWTGEAAYAFGGARTEWSSTPEGGLTSTRTLFDDIVRIGLDGSVSVVGHLPSARWGVGAAYDETTGTIVLAGGLGDSGTLLEMLRFDPATDTLEPMGPTLPWGDYWHSSTVVDGMAYFLGEALVGFDLDTGSFVDEDVAGGGFGSIVARSDGALYVLQGDMAGSGTSEVVALDGCGWRSIDTIEAPLSRSAVTTDGTTAFAFGGADVWGTLWNPAAVAYGLPDVDCSL